MAHWESTPAVPGWYPQAMASIAPASIIVLDDLPRIPGDDALAERLVQFAQAARAAGIHIVTTSQYELPSRIRHIIGDAFLHECPIHPFTDDEATDIFRQYGAPETFLKGNYVNFLNAHAAGHPLLLAASAEFLKSRSWHFRDEEFEALLRGDHTKRVLPEVIQRLVRTLGEQPRELLYRLTLPIGNFETSTVTLLAAVVPGVCRPQEQLSELLGSWVQRDTSTKLAVSPLVKPLGKTELDAEVRRQCFRELARALTQKETINSYEGERNTLQPGRARVRHGSASLYSLVCCALRAKKAGRIAGH